MKSTLTPALAVLALISHPALAAEKDGNKAPSKVGEIIVRGGGLHGYIGCEAIRPPVPTEYGAGISFYTAVWPLVDEPVANFQIGLAGTWINFPVNDQGKTVLAQDVTYYPRSALYDAIKAWRKDGPAITGEFGKENAWKAKLNTNNPRFDQEGKNISGVKKFFTIRVFEDNTWGLQWTGDKSVTRGDFPQYYKQVGDERVVVEAKDVPEETGLIKQAFPLAKAGQPYTSPSTGAWAEPGPKSEEFTANLLDGSVVTYRWYRFVDQPSFQQYAWSDEKKAALQAFVEKIHANWPIDRNYMAPPSHGELVSLDPGLIVSPPKRMEKGYVPIVTGQAAK